VVELLAEAPGSNLQFIPALKTDPGKWSFASQAIPPGRSWRAVGTEVVFAQAYRATVFSVPVRAKGSQRERLSIDLSGGLEISGEVVDGKGKPLAGVSVVAREASAVERGSVTGADGCYAIRGLSPGKVTVEAMRWKVRDLAGCGTGARDVAGTLERTLPLPAGESADFRVEDLLPAPRVGDPAPAFEVRTVDGRPISLRDLAGKVVLVDFWATWCGSCRLELPGLIDAYAALARGGKFEIVGVSVDTDLALVPRFVASRGMTWPQTALGPSAVNPVARLFNVNSTPSTALIDAQGRIAALNLVGAPLRKKVEELLARD
ncbi:MAG TPA: redoxin family protein, partial [Gemmatimonadales bacterium]|nr:redoxin family protein [Gemmatimonadales bacterium]